MDRNPTGIIAETSGKLESEAGARNTGALPDAGMPSPVARDDDHRLIIGRFCAILPRGQVAAERLELARRVPVAVPLEAVFHKGEELVLILSQGHADQMPTPGSLPVELEYGKTLGRFEFAEVDAPQDHIAGGGVATAASTRRGDQ